MATYIIGDIQGCLEPLRRLLSACQFNPHADRLWLCGDLVNRGPDSLGVLRFLSELPVTPICVLGNHDLSLLAIHSGAIPMQPSDTLQSVLDAPEGDALINWLTQFPLLHYDETQKAVLTHAGLYPLWSIDENRRYAREVHAVLLDEHLRNDFLQHMYGNTPSMWSETLQQHDRWRFIVNVFTRMRMLSETGALELDAKGGPDETPHLTPWYRFKPLNFNNHRIFFGHWAALRGECPHPNIHALDTGCFWGGQLTAYCLETANRISVPCK